MPLTDIICKNAKPETKPKKLSDGKGLYLEVMPSGSKYWRMKYRFNKKEKRLALGVYPEISLKEVREKRDEARKQLADGIDPSQLKKQKKLTQYISSENSFEVIAREWHADRKLAWTDRHAKYVLRRLEADIFPVLGFKAIQDITAPELLAALRKIEEREAIDIVK